MPIQKEEASLKQQMKQKKAPKKDELLRSFFALFYPNLMKYSRFVIRRNEKNYNFADINLKNEANLFHK